MGSKRENPMTATFQEVFSEKVQFLIIVSYDDLWYNEVLFKFTGD